MKAFVGVTDNDWFTFLSKLPTIDEVNFWQPGGSHQFKALSQGEPFLFKLHSPYDYIVGGGFFAYSTILPCSLAWNTFGEKNGASSISEMRSRIERYRRTIPSKEDYHIGCILLEQPFFFGKSEWVPIPSDWSRNIVQGKGYDLTTSIGMRLWDDVQQRLTTNNESPWGKANFLEKSAVAYGTPQVIMPRLGQGSFRVIVTDAYNRRCAVTQERTLPALEAGHIKPFSQNGPHMVKNGILLRSDIHRLFDLGYVTITKDVHFQVSKKIREEFENGRDYYALNGKRLSVPSIRELQPGQEFVTWHNENVYLG